MAFRPAGARRRCVVCFAGGGIVAILPRCNPVAPVQPGWAGNQLTGDVVSKSQDDQAFIRTFIAVIALLTVGTIIILSLAIFAGTFDQSTREARAQLERERTERRLQPVGAVHRDGDAPPVELQAAAPEEADDDVVRSGAEVYQAVCMACHAQGVMNAVKTGDGDGWQALLDERGFDGLVENAINGIRAMPPRGGDRGLSDEEVRDAVVHMLEESGISVDRD